VRWIVSEGRWTEFLVLLLKGGESHLLLAFSALNMSEDDHNLYVRAELPGVAPENIEITTKENNLILKGERKIPAEGEKVSYHRKERDAGNFRRIISLPTRVDSDRVTAICKNGVLTVTLPKAEEAKPRQISVRSE